MATIGKNYIHVFKCYLNFPIPNKYYNIHKLNGVNLYTTEASIKKLI